MARIPDGIAHGPLESHHENFESFLIEAEEAMFIEFSESDFFDFRGEYISLFEEWLNSFDSSIAFVRRRRENVLSTFTREISLAFQEGFRSIRLQKARIFRGGREEEGVLDNVFGFFRKALSGRFTKMRLIPRIKLLIITGQASFLRDMEFLESMQAGVDLAYIDTHPSNLGPDADEICNTWRGRIISMSGGTEGFPTHDDAKEQGMFHPHCTHGTNVLTPAQYFVAIKEKPETIQALKELE